MCRRDRAKDDIVVLGQFLGDLAMASGDEQYRRTLAHYMRIYDFTPAAVVSDLHPGYFTTLIADELEAKGLRRARVQHHHAHIAAVMEEHGLDGAIIGIAFDGTGYGNDGVLWGREFLVAGRSSFTRAAHFSEFALPGGESAIRDVWKIGASLLKAYCGDDAALGAFPGAGPVLEIIAKKINSPLTTSVGRLFDGVAALIGLRQQVTFEGEAAMELEYCARRDEARGQPVQVGHVELDFGLGMIAHGAVLCARVGRELLTAEAQIRWGRTAIRPYGTRGCYPRPDFRSSGNSASLAGAYGNTPLQNFTPTTRSGRLDPHLSLIHI